MYWKLNHYKFIVSHTLLFSFLLMLPLMAQSDKQANPRVLLKTSEGDVQLELFRDQAPETVDNFIGLAEGTREFTDPKTGEKVKRPFYDGLTFHRVIDNFMIQGGCPLGTGTGGPGYQFKDEISAESLGLDDAKAMENDQPHPWLLIRSQADFQRSIIMPIAQKLKISSEEEFQKRIEEVKTEVNKMSIKEAYENLGYVYDASLKSSKPERGVIAMANSGPNTNGSQFFINVTDTPHLTGKHTVFGKVVEGMDVVDKISKVQTIESGKPEKEVEIQSIRLIGEKAANSDSGS